MTVGKHAGNGCPRFTELNLNWLEVFCDGCPSIRFVGRCDIDPGWPECATGTYEEPWSEKCIRHDRYLGIDERQREIDRLILGEAV